jgi:hypothetical protein
MSDNSMHTPFYVYDSSGPNVKLDQLNSLSITSLENEILHHINASSHFCIISKEIY